MSLGHKLERFLQLTSVPDAMLVESCTEGSASAQQMKSCRCSPMYACTWLLVWSKRRLRQALSSCLRQLPGKKQCAKDHPQQWKVMTPIIRFRVARGLRAWHVTHMGVDCG